METPITQATGHGNRTVTVYPNRVELRSGWRLQNAEALCIRKVASVSINGLVNCTLSIESNKGPIYRLNRTTLSDARDVKAAIETRSRRQASTIEVGFALQAP